MLILAILGVVGGIIVFVTLFVVFIQDTIIIQTHVQTTATIVDKQVIYEVKNDGDRYPEYYVTYAYTTELGEFSGTDTTPYETYKQLAIGDPMPIFYDPNDHQVNALDVVERRNGRMAGILVGAGIIAVSLIVLYLLDWEWRQVDDDE